jgi:hypothetical protein
MLAVILVAALNRPNKINQKYIQSNKTQPNGKKHF